jgi:DNA invertase Pin-like site-specific DNA recombinase
MAKAARAAGQSPTEIAKELGCSRATLYRVTAEQAA